MQNNVATITRDTSYLREDVAARQRTGLVKWLCEADYFKQHHDFLIRRTPGTGEWFLQHQEFRAWFDSKAGMLLCPGDPGVGKTILAASVVEALLERAQTPQQPVLFIYFNYRRHDEQTMAHAVSTLLRQILEVVSEIPTHAQTFYQMHHQRKTTPTALQVKHVLESVVGELKGLSIVLDALDECNEATRPDILSLVTRLRTLTPTRCLATSRKLPSITSDPSFLRIPQLEIRASNDDLSTYIESRFDGFKAKPQAELREKLVISVIHAAGGMQVSLTLSYYQAEWP